MTLDAELNLLQRRLAEVDLRTEPRPLGRVTVQKILLLKLQRLKVKMYQEVGHKTPHVHIDYGPEQHVASYSVHEPERLAGSLDRKYDETVREWIAENRAGLLGIWASLQTGQDASVMVGELKRGDA